MEIKQFSKTFLLLPFLFPLSLMLLLLLLFLLLLFTRQ